MSTDLKQLINSVFANAGIQVNGEEPWDIQVHDERFYSRVMQKTSIGFGEAYMDGWWDCLQLDICLEKIFRVNLLNRTKKNYRLLIPLIGYYLKSIFLNQQSKDKAFDVGRVHYDLGNDLFQAMLDPTLSYSCGYWKEAKDLAQAQQAKLKLICDKLYLQPGMKILDIGCGWGGLAAFAAQHYGVEVTGITISKQQYEFAVQRCRGLPITIMLQDYRSLQGEFDRIVSVGMFEHVGYKNHRIFMAVVTRLLKKQGLFLLHTIGGNESTIHANPWINKYIFPHGVIPSLKQVGKATEKLLMMEDWHNFGTDYDKTLMAWHDNFVANWPQLHQQYDERFYRMWKFYLLSCAGSFRARETQLWQIVLSKGIEDGYQSVR